MGCLSKETVNSLVGRGCVVLHCVQENIAKEAQSVGAAVPCPGGVAGTAHSAFLDEKASKPNLPVCLEASVHPSSPAEPND